MKFIATILIPLTIILCSCERKKGESVSSESSVSLKVGNESTDYVVAENWTETTEQLTAVIRPLWDELSSGVSEEFQLVQSSSSDVSPAIKEKVNVKFGEDATLSSTKTLSSQRLRFFRHRNGQSGIEAIVDGGWVTVVSGESVEWPEIERYLDEYFLDFGSFAFPVERQAAVGDSIKHPS